MYNNNRCYYNFRFVRPLGVTPAGRCAPREFGRSVRVRQGAPAFAVRNARKETDVTFWKTARTCRGLLRDFWWPRQPFEETFEAILLVTKDVFDGPSSLRYFDEIFETILIMIPGVKR